MVHRHPDAPTELYIDNLGVTPSRRREGRATRLLDELVAWGLEQGCEEAWVGTEADNGPARALYEGRGSEAETFVMYAYSL
jgi:aminoglycoside 6'-N-acetyltransferase I